VVSGNKKLAMGIASVQQAHWDEPLSPLGERVDRGGAFIRRRGPGEGVVAFLELITDN
jgi:hypothetical protein